MVVLSRTPQLFSREALALSTVAAGSARNAQGWSILAAVGTPDAHQTAGGRFTNNKNTTHSLRARDVHNPIALFPNHESYPGGSPMMTSTLDSEHLY